MAGGLHPVLPPNTSRGRKFAWADAESGMQTRHDALPCGVSALLLNPDRQKQKLDWGVSRARGSEVLSMSSISFAD
jgi:hypothetical protein